MIDEIKAYNMIKNCAIVRDPKTGIFNAYGDGVLIASFFNPEAAAIFWRQVEYYKRKVHLLRGPRVVPIKGGECENTIGERIPENPQDQ